MSETPALANDEYRANLRATWIADPADDAILVDAIPANLPTIVTVGWKTDFQTVFSVEGTSGDNASNYALTGVTRIKGFDGNLPEGMAVNCLNHEEYFNQWGGQIAAVQEIAEEAEALITGLMKSTSIASSATPTPTGDATFNRFYITALADDATLAAPSGTPENGNTLIIRIKDDGTARALTWNAIYREVGMELPETTVEDKTIYLGFIHNSADSKWDLLAVNEEE